MSGKIKTDSKVVLVAMGLVLVASLLLSRGLVDSWDQDPGSAYGMVSFGIWIVSLILALFTYGRIDPNRWFVSAAALCLVAGALSGISLALHIAIAICAGSLLKDRWARLLAIGTALSWFPALGWLFHTSIGTFPGSIRLIIACVSFLLLIPMVRRLSVEEKEAFS